MKFFLNFFNTSKIIFKYINNSLKNIYCHKYSLSYFDIRFYYKLYRFVFLKNY